VDDVAFDVDIRPPKTGQDNALSKVMMRLMCII
jgi:hypothetical protein